MRKNNKIIVTSNITQPQSTYSPAELREMIYDLFKREEQSRTVEHDKNRTS